MDGNLAKGQGERGWWVKKDNTKFVESHLVIAWGIWVIG